MSVYIDVLFGLNIMMNSIILILTALAAGIAYKKWRILAAACLGGGFVVSGVWPEFVFLHSAPAKLVVSAVLIMVAFGVRSIRINVLLLGIFYVVSFILGGAVVGWSYFWQNSSYLQFEHDRLNQIDAESLIAGTAAGVLLVGLVMRRMLSRMFRRGNFYPVMIEYRGRRAEVTSLLDTGNCLYTPVGRKPVVVVEYSKLEGILSAAVSRHLSLTAPELWLTNLDACPDNDWLARVQIIPYQGVGTHSMLLGFRPDQVSIMTKSGLQSAKDVVIAIYTGRLSNDGTYAALLHPAVISSIANQEEVGVCASVGR